jgi:sulfite exporter TauE/SafE
MSNVEKFSYDNRSVRNFAFATIIFGVVGMLVGILIALPPFAFGLMNGMLPCGLVYLGIAGALTMGTVWGGMGFMLFFGLGTVPAMMLVLWGQKWISASLRASLRNVYPYVMLCLGMYLIYRGSMSTFPLELNFVDALRNPVMCH